MAGILVIAEANEGALAPISGELLGAARKLAGEGAGSVTAFIAGSDALGKELIALGADAAIADTNPALQGALAEVYLPAVQAALQQSGADIVLMGQTALGRDLGPMLAFALGTAVSMETVDLKYTGGKLIATRACYGGNARAEVSFKNAPAIATVKAKSFDALAPDASRSGSVSTIDVAGEARVKVLGVQKAESTGIRLEDAPVVVSGGRGLGDPSGFKMLEELAALLKGATGASRAACDLGWYPPSQQVGLTGKVVSPNLYIAVAISGASQHMAGMAGSKNIVAINKDPDANMVKAAKYAIIDDYKKVVPALIEEIKKLG
ncbi:MAG: electron transfer flavoprotein subunit alpha/FixB family protein [Tepidiforma sp.]|jgi:electron transfer flavoprotein alpha subunit|uniref:electron transfer flavoprotein subunit alpha/FixB family protein n=1 Tax=Tepidiforma sp. TaxID=2682230 RepID=UPI0021DD3D78|nr:electron transfer flavoprotein subunit alpha/FixB family protein [Tepidiforma sp.]MCX7618341.1 electron transfer flavoprotein subunit alpha/FixB family protein [Tepidiforma sp.]GIW17946.1 MAG: electron transfer flavoprotein subunit alpha [Tepidiforma sp.]